MYDLDEESRSGPSNFVPAFRRHRIALALGILVLLALASIITIALPPVYRSTGTVLVETQQIPTDLVKSTITSLASERIDVIKQRVMTREKLLDIIDRYAYFDKSGTPAELNELLDDVRENITITVIESQTGSRRANETAIAFSVAFDSKNPAIAQSVANDLVTLFLSENVKARTERASETTEFLEGEAQKVKRQLDATELAVAEFKLENKDTLPEHLDLYVDMLDQSRRKADAIDRSITSAVSQGELLTTQLTLLRSQLAGGSSVAQNNLDELRNDYRRLSLKYKEQHPDLIELRSQIESLESQAPSDEQRRLSPEELTIRGQLAEIDAQVKALRRDKIAEDDKIADLEERIIAIPQVERGLAALNRDYVAKVEQYNLIRGKTMEAGMSESLEQGRKAERFSILEPPLLPTSAEKPNRPKVFAMGSVLAFGLPIGIVLLIGFRDRSIRGSEAIKEITKAKPLIEIPYIRTEAELSAGRRAIGYSLMATAALVGVTLLAVHLLYMPIDLLLLKVASRF
ncbi:hypothetical protein [Allohahella marinimesophila]|uniref:Polysaccharide chain length determinant protein (PEP-CTERM system associated) n=1 Tax=Allohahella marinimesophila TaxID=1054972 RepID=A0ABP7P975_9GAMM